MKKAKILLFGLLLSMLFGTQLGAEVDPFAPLPSDRKEEVKKERKAFAMNRSGPSLYPDFDPLKIEETWFSKTFDVSEDEYRAQHEQSLIKFFEQNGVSFIDTPGAYLYIPRNPPVVMRESFHRWPVVISQTPENLEKIAKILDDLESAIELHNSTLDGSGLPLEGKEYELKRKAAEETIDALYKTKEEPDAAGQRR